MSETTKIDIVQPPDGSDGSDSSENEEPVVEDKKCIRCEKKLALGQFSRRFRTKGTWVQSHCKDCSAILKQQRRNRRKERPVPATLYVGMKYCRGHNREEPKSGFGMNKISIDFLDHYCKEWRSEIYKTKKKK